MKTDTSAQNPIAYYDLDGLHLCDDLEVDAAWAKQANATIFCPECGAIRVGAGSIDAIVDGDVSGIPLGGVPTCNVGFASKEFLAQFGWDNVSQSLWLGKLCDRHGVELADFVTFKGKEKPLIIRGTTPRSYGGSCEVCGKTRYFPLPVKGRYLTEASLTGAQLYESNLKQLIVNETMYKRVDRKKYRALGFSKLPVIKEPLDGLPAVFK